MFLGKYARYSNLEYIWLDRSENLKKHTHLPIKQSKIWI